jgi:hypothetical protein
MREKTIPDKIEEAYKSDKKPKFISLKNKRFFAKSLTEAFLTRYFFGIEFVPILSSNASVGVLWRFF